MRKIIPEEGRILLKKVQVTDEMVKVRGVLVPVTSSDDELYEVVDDTPSFIKGEIVIMGGPWPKSFKFEGHEYFIVKMEDVIATVREFYDELV